MNDENRSEIIFYEGEDNGLRIKTLIEDETEQARFLESLEHGYYMKTTLFGHLSQKYGIIYIGWRKAL